MGNFSGSGIESQAGPKDGTKSSVSIDGSVEAKGGDTILSATDRKVLDNKGNIRVTGDLKAAADIRMSTISGNIQVGGTT
ncbi:hypothetical protein, partial [uncultured Megasphaera sp.]|uniref:hypothetical protein n=1 Tax=uncultured Megasphaera sp. TaxID=165188 RepID=UPI002805DB97